MVPCNPLRAINGDVYVAYQIVGEGLSELPLIDRRALHLESRK